MRQGLQGTMKFPRVPPPPDQAEFATRNKLLSSWANLLGEWLKAIQLDLYNWMRKYSLFLTDITNYSIVTQGLLVDCRNHKCPLCEHQSGYSRGPALMEAERWIIVTNISRARHCLKGFILIDSFNPHSKPLGRALIATLPSTLQVKTLS